MKSSSELGMDFFAGQNGGKQLVRDLEAAGFDVRRLESFEERTDRGASEARPVLIYSLRSLSKEVLEEIQQAKIAQPNKLVICAISNYREAKRLRLIEAGADEGVQVDELEARLPELLKQFAPPHAETSAEANKEAGSGIAASAERETAAPSGHMFFQLGQGELSNALQFLCMSPRVGRLEVHFEESGETAQLYLADQTVVLAEAGELEGIMAMADIINRPGVRKASFYEGEEAPKKSIEQPLSQFLLEASVMADEMRAQAAG